MLEGGFCLLPSIAGDQRVIVAAAHSQNVAGLYFLDFCSAIRDRGSS
jgi:hypothetical protein